MNLRVTLQNGTVMRTVGKITVESGRASWASERGISTVYVTEISCIEVDKPTVEEPADYREYLKGPLDPRD